MSDVAIIGAGVAGLAAARTLRKAGHPCTIFEATDRIGGVVRSESMSGNAAGITVDLGFHTANTWYPALKEVLTPGEYAALNFKSFKPALQSLTDDGLALICDPVRAPHLIPAFLRSKARSNLSLRDVRALRRWLGSEMTHRSSLEVRKLKPSRVEGDVSVSESLDEFGVTRELRRAVIDPLVHAFLHDQGGASSAIVAKWVLGAMLRGTLAVPEGGMGELSATLGRIPGVRVELNSRVSGITHTTQGVQVELADRGETHSFDYAILAVPPKVEEELVGTRCPRMSGVATWWFVSDEPVSADAFIAVDGTRRTLISAAAELTSVAPSYAPGKHLVAGNVLMNAPDSLLPDDATVRDQLGLLFGVDARGWQLVTRQVMPDATPIISPHRVGFSQREFLATQEEGCRLVLAGSHHATPTLDGAVRSGQRAAALVVDALGR